MRDKLIVAGLTIIIAGIGISLFLRNSRDLTFQILSASTSATSSVSVPFTKLAQGTESSIMLRTNYLITSQTELDDLWKLVGASSTPPQVAFEKQSVLAVFAGKEPSVAIAVSKVEDMNVVRLVSVTLLQPEPTCPQPSGHASSYELVVVPATTLGLAHADTVTTLGCRD
jgi:hypothetical protein